VQHAVEQGYRQPLSKAETLFFQSGTEGPHSRVQELEVYSDVRVHAVLLVPQQRPPQERKDEAGEGLQGGTAAKGCVHRLGGAPESGHLKGDVVVGSQHHQPVLLQKRPSDSVNSVADLRAALES
jgi:hypothetical protein